MKIFSHIVELEKSTRRAALCTVVKVSGSTPRKVGAKMIVIEDHSPHGSIIGSIGGGAIEHLIRSKALDLINEGGPLLLVTSLKNDLGMCCGGEMSVFIEPIIKKPSFICFGAGHIAQALCPLMLELDYEVTVVDERKELLERAAFMKISQRISDVSGFSFKDMPFSSNTFVVVATHDHDLDQQMIEKILPHDFKYCALVGSKRKALMTQKRLRAKGLSEAAIERILCPAGLDIHAQTPQEIAVSIAAQMTLVRNGSKDRGLDRSSG